MVFEVYSYWNIQELRLVFNAVAAIVGSGDYLGLLQTLALIGMISLAMAVLAGFAQLPDFGRWIFMLALFNAVLLVPKVNVVLVDRTGTQPPVTVANVPLGLASFAHSVSHVGDWLTRTFETAFSLPADIQFRQNGTLWGHRVQQEMLHSKFDNSILTSNLLEFYRECVVPEFATGFVVASDMAKSNDIWTYLSGKTNPGRLVTIHAIPGGNAAAEGTHGCDFAYTHLTAQVTLVSNQQITTLGNRLYPGQATAIANASVQSAIQTSTNYIFGISNAAVDTVKQAAMSNFMIDAQYMLPAQIGDAAGAAANLAQAQAIRSTSDSYRLMAKLSQSTLPKIKNIVEIVQYSVFPIIMLLILLAGHKGGMVIKYYVMSLVWVQLWPPLYAVMHLIMTMHSQELAAMTGGLGLSMSQYSLVNNAFISDEAIAGMIAATAIPAIAAAIVQGGNVGASSIAGAISSSTSEAGRAGAAMALGNTQMGNASIGNHSADTLTMGQYAASPTLNDGRMSMTGGSGVTHTYGMDSQGRRTEILDAGGALHKLPATVQFVRRQSGSLKAEAEQTERAAVSESTAAQASFAADFTRMREYAQRHQKDNSAKVSDQTRSQVAFREGVADAVALTDRYAKDYKLTQAQQAELFAAASVEASGGLSVLGNGVQVKGGAGAKGSSAAGTQQTQDVAHSLAQDKRFMAAIDKMKMASQSKDFTQGDTASRTGSASLASSLKSAFQHTDEARASHEKSIGFKREAERTDNASGEVASNGINQYMNWATTQKTADGHRYTNTELAEMMLGHHGTEGEDVAKMLQDRYLNEVYLPSIEKKFGTPENNVAAQHELNKGQIPGTDAVTKFNQHNEQKVSIAQNRAGVTPETGPANKVAGEVRTMTGDAAGQIHDKHDAINKEGEPLKKETSKNTDPANVSAAALAAANAANAVMPAVTTVVEKTTGILPDASTAKKTVANDPRSTKEAAVDAAIEVGGVLVGGVAGKVAGKAGGKALGKPAGDATEAVEKNILDNAAERAEEKIAARAATEGAPSEGAFKAAEKKTAANAAENARIRQAADAGARAEHKTAATADGLSMAAGAGAGGILGNAGGETQAKTNLKGDK